MNYYEPEFKEKLVKLYLQGETKASIVREYGISKASLNNWISFYTKVEESGNLPLVQNAEEHIEIGRLRKELQEKEKEILFLKKAAAFFAKEIDSKN